MGVRQPGNQILVGRDVFATLMGVDEKGEEKK